MTSPPPAHCPPPPICLHLLLCPPPPHPPSLCFPKPVSSFFFSGRTTIRATPPPPCPCSALKGFPSWRLSWWWGLSVYYLAFCSPNSFPSLSPPLPPDQLTHSLARRHCSWKKKRERARDQDVYSACTFIEFKFETHKTHTHRQPCQVISLWDCQATSAFSLLTEARRASRVRKQDSKFHPGSLCWAQCPHKQTWTHTKKDKQRKNTGRELNSYRCLCLKCWHVAQEAFL